MSAEQLIATSYRYPTTPHGRIPSVKHNIQEALANLDAALQEIAARFEVDLARPGSPARRPGPIR